MNPTMSRLFGKIVVSGVLDPQGLEGRERLRKELEKAENVKQLSVWARTLVRAALLAASR